MSSFLTKERSVGNPWVTHFYVLTSEATFDFEILLWECDTAILTFTMVLSIWHTQYYYCNVIWFVSKFSWPVNNFNPWCSGYVYPGNQFPKLVCLRLFDWPSTYPYWFEDELVTFWILFDTWTLGNSSHKSTRSFGHYPDYCPPHPFWIFLFLPFLSTRDQDFFIHTISSMRVVIYPQTWNLSRPAVV